MPALAIPSSLQAFAARNHSNPPRHLGTRYDRSGVFLPEPGNTVVSHLLPDAPETAAILALRDRMQAMPRADLLAFTAASSLHMTLFQGVIEFRRTEGYWPPGVPLDAPIETVTELYRDRLAGFRGHGSFGVKVDAVTPLGLVVSGATAADEEVLRAWRDALADVFGYRHPDHDTYVFHITFAYILDWIPDADLAAVAAFLERSLEEIRAQAPVIRLAPPAFCRFEDMNRFEELVVLR